MTIVMVPERCKKWYSCDISIRPGIEINVFYYDEITVF